MKISTVFFVAASAFAAVSMQAQTSLADMQQDVSIMRREVGQLRLEVEQLRRENDQLSQKVKKLEGSAGAADAVSAQVSAVRSQTASQIDKMKREIIEQVKKDMENMASQTNTQISKLANAIGKVPQVAPQKTFSEDYPKTGITHTIRSGDSLSKLAREFNSRIKWIQNANQIVDPARGLRIGESVFIPQK